MRHDHHSFIHPRGCHCRNCADEQSFREELAGDLRAAGVGLAAAIVFSAALCAWHFLPLIF